MVRKLLAYGICLVASLGVVSWLITVLDNTLPDRWAIGVGAVAAPVALISTWALAWFIVRPIFFPPMRFGLDEPEASGEKKEPYDAQHFDQTRDNPG